MAKSGTRLRFSYGWLIVLAGVAAFGLSTWIRLQVTPRPSPLEQLIEAGAPAENVTAIATLKNGDNIIGTTTGAIRRQGSKLTRLPGLTGDVRSVAEASDGGLLLAGHGTGIRSYQDGSTRTLLAGDANGVSNAGGRLLALLGGKDLMASTNAGATWAKLTDFQGEQLTTIAVNPQNPNEVAAGGIQGGIYLSRDGGQNWEAVSAPGGTVTALLFDSSTKTVRLWACVNGSVLYSDDSAATWQRPARKPSTRPLVALAPGKDGGILGVSADGLLVAISD